MYFWHVFLGLLLLKTLGNLWAILRAPRIAEPTTIDDVVPFLERGDAVAAVFWYQQLCRTGRVAAERAIGELARNPGVRRDLPPAPWIGRYPRRNGLIVIGAELVFLVLAIGLQFWSHVKEPPAALLAVAIAAMFVVVVDRTAAHRSDLKIQRVPWAAGGPGLASEMQAQRGFFARLVDAWRGMRWLFFGYFTTVLGTFAAAGRVGSSLVWGFLVGLLSLVFAGIAHSRIDRVLGPDSCWRDNLFSVFVLGLVGAVLVVVATHGQ